MAVAFLACEPTILAHAGLATTDMAISACLLALTYHYRTSREPGANAGWFWGVAVPAFWFGAAVLAKASGLVFGPLCLLAVEGERLVRSNGAGPTILARLRSAISGLALTGIGGLLLVTLYCGSSDGWLRRTMVQRAEQMPFPEVAVPIA